MSLAGKIVAVTGASGGLGLHLAREIASAGAKVALMARNAEALAKVAAECGDDALAFPGDVTSEDDARNFIERIKETFGRLDHFVACAGRSMWANFEEVDDLSLFRKLMEVNYLGVVNGAHAALPLLKDSGGQIVVISSIQAKVGVPHHSGYVASKHALDGFVDTLRHELDGSGVNLLSIYPHWIRGTDMRKNALGADANPVGERKRSHSSSGVDVDEVARATVKAMEKRKQNLFVPGSLRFVPLLKNLFPGLLRRIIRRKVGGQK